MRIYITVNLNKGNKTQKTTMFVKRIKNMNIVIRRALPGDHEKIRPLQEEIADLHRDGRPDLFRTEARYYSNEAFKEKILNPDQFIYIAENDVKEVVGYAFAYIIRYREHSTFRDFDSFYIDDICVLKSCRRCGIGKKLFDQCKRQAMESYCHQLDLGVWSFNSDAIAFYEVCGMHERLRRMEMILN